MWTETSVSALHPLIFRSEQYERHAGKQRSSDRGEKKRKMRCGSLDAKCEKYFKKGVNDHDIATGR